MAGSLGEAVLDLSADSNPMMKDIEKAKPGALAALSNLGIVGGKLLAAGIMLAATAIVAITTQVWNAGNTLDEAYDKIQQKTGATGDNLAGLQADFNAVFTSVPTDAGTAADALSILNSRLGATGPTLQGLTANLLEFSRMTGTDAATNADQFAQMVGNWQIPVDQAAGSLDSLFVISQQTGIGTDVLMQQMTDSGPVLRAYGVGFEQAGMFLAELSKSGIDSTTVMMGMKSAAAKYAAAGVDVNTGLQDTIEQIKNAKSPTEALNIATETFGSRSAPAMLDAINSGLWDTMVTPLEDTKGAILETSEATMDWGERWTMFKNQMTVALGPAGMGLMDAVSAGLQAIVDVVSRPDVQAGLMAIVNGIVALAQQGAAALPGIIDGFFQFVDFLRNNQGVLIGILAAIGVAIAAFVYTTVIPAAISLIAALAPILLIMAAVALVAYLVYEAWTNNWGGIREAVMNFWAIVQPYFQMLVDWLQVQVPIAIQALKDFWTNILLPAVQAFFGFLAAEVFPRLGELVQWLAVNVPAGIQTLVTWWTTLQANVTAVWTAIKMVVTTAMTMIHSAISLRMSEITSYFNHFKEVAAKVQVFIQSKLTEAWDGLAKVISRVNRFIQDVITALRQVGKALPDWLIPGSPTPFEIGLWGINDALKAMAKASLPTLSASLSGSSFAPAALNAGSMATGSMGNSRQYIFNMSNTTLDEDQLRRALARAEVLYG